MITNKDLKKRILEISYKHKLAHLGSCLTAVDIIDEIYATKKPNEKFILSAGHSHLAHLVVMEKYNRGDSTGLTRFDAEELVSKYGIHCDRLAGCDVSTGSLGQGLPIAVGMALADRTRDVYCLISDGETAEGSVYEALRFANEQKLTNLKVHVNFNGYGAYRETSHDEILRFLLLFRNLDMRLWQTNVDEWPKWLQAQIGHYVIMSYDQHQEALRCLQ